MVRRIGFLTIGQSPRVDVLDDIKPYINTNVKIVECGALDDFTYSEVVEKLSPELGHMIYVTRMRDGTQVKISKEKIIPLIQKCIYKLQNRDVDLIIILCSGEFPEFGSKTPIIYPSKLLKSFAEAFYVSGSVGILIPIEEQISYAKKKWGSIFSDLYIRAISPYRSSLEEFKQVALDLMDKDVKLAILDCIGYSIRHKQVVKEVLSKPVISARTVVIRAINELYE